MTPKVGEVADGQALAGRRVVRSGRSQLQISVGYVGQVLISSPHPEIAASIFLLRLCDLDPNQPVRCNDCGSKGGGQSQSGFPTKSSAAVLFKLFPKEILGPLLLGDACATSPAA